MYYSSISIPALYCPFNSQISPYASAVESHTSQWVEKFGIRDDIRGYTESRFAYMTSRFYPTAEYSRLCLANDLLVLLFLLDDVFDNKDEEAQNPDNLKKLLYSCLEILKNDRTYTLQSGGNILAALTDVWKRMKDCTSPEYQQTFVQDMLKLFSAVDWQNKNVNASRIPSVADYIESRPLIGGAHIAATLIELTEQVHLPANIINHKKISALTMLCGHLGCWANDLYSLAKEIEHGDTHNLVLVMREEKKLNIENAINETVRLHNQEMIQFERIFHSLPSFSDEMDEEVYKYAFCLAMIVRGNIDWSLQDTSRYNTAGLVGQA
ncbi:Terpene synthase family, metal binding domain [Chitinophaga sp. YR573]|uniref:terpene synthase family protein n=1 Tax=Chitinophaga sp. YR573 TaxID=1881040 RepID=UPI0008D7F219|nr:hypothetical protein [Chitinophaga sp. YR573]SEW22187.1 Terpene synthase family, metal binding domain [Chitinophaga sp. YR573]